ncbi:MAG: NYN domain-containing protein [Phycisphaerales bacterium]|nr:NYN domain-containing protein [Phycisphaerales bacterium]
MAEQSALKVGVYVDVANISQCGGRGMRFDVLRDFASRGAVEPIRLNAYVTFDARRADNDGDFRRLQMNFHSTLRDFGYKVIVKEVKWYQDESGAPYGKANADLDMAVDALLQSENLDRVLLATGDGDFVQVVRALQNKGCRVEVVAFDSVSGELKREADHFICGHLIPNLLPINDGGVAWGAEGSRVRGVCYSFLHEKMFGFLKFLKEIRTGLWNTDTRRKDSPYGSAFVHGSELRGFDLTLLPSREYVFEFSLSTTDKGLQARDIVLVSSPASARRLEVHPPSLNHPDQGGATASRGAAAGPVGSGVAT